MAFAAAAAVPAAAWFNTVEKRVPELHCDAELCEHVHFTS